MRHLDKDPALVVREARPFNVGLPQHGAASRHDPAGVMAV